MTQINPPNLKVFYPEIHMVQKEVVAYLPLCKIAMNVLQHMRILHSEGSIGSGFVYDESGKIVTNYHVVQGAQAILVKFLNGNGYKGTIVGVEPLIDLAVIQLDPSALYNEKIVPLPLANTSEIRIGTPIVAIGNPIGFTGSMTEGIISQVGRIQKGLFFPDSWVGDLI